MDKLFYGSQFITFFGVVEDNSDHLGLGRVRVRVIGHHNQDSNEIPTHALPYASIMLPTTNGNNGGIGTSFSLAIGTRVFGTFLDGEVRQQLMILGVLSGEHKTNYTSALPINCPPQQPNINPLLGHDSSHIEQSCPSGELATTNSANILKPDPRLLKLNKANFIYPCSGYVSDTYGTRNGKHHGVDIASFKKQSDSGSPHLSGRFRGGVGGNVFAIADGIVQHIFKHSQGQKQISTTYDQNGQGSRSYGNAIVIKHVIDGITLLSVYAHLGENQDAGKDSDISGVNVAIDQVVTKGQIIGTLGRTHNRDNTTHLHFEIRVGSALERGGINSIDPAYLFPKMANIHTSILSWTNSTMDYKTIPYLSEKDLPIQSLEIPI